MLTLKIDQIYCLVMGWVIKACVCRLWRPNGSLDIWSRENDFFIFKFGSLSVMLDRKGFYQLFLCGFDYHLYIQSFGPRYY